jgi:hypothetical protein
MYDYLISLNIVTDHENRLLTISETPLSVDKSLFTCKELLIDRCTLKTAKKLILTKNRLLKQIKTVPYHSPIFGLLDIEICMINEKIEDLSQN